jgi:hypothetical protein
MHPKLMPDWCQRLDLAAFKETHRLPHGFVILQYDPAAASTASATPRETSPAAMPCDLKYDEREHLKQESLATHQFMPAVLESENGLEKTMLLKLTEAQSAQSRRPHEVRSDGSQGKGTGDKDDALNAGYRWRF